ncbi:Phosphonate ABC transporter phosphate-binding periplasmic component (TC 3.A.1.9.1) [hydrothermal vent metagenome]|uniref:Phosphonate ABC transporter phosphate-binding periplasmic component (TC 3.A.1.9.1) n=1 Tax=hydrothermal vent metagenome TaxID=652676 RepID=A0A1W1C7U3_9ZZZZ
MKNFISFLAVSFLMIGCTSGQDVKPWEKASLAKDTMQFGGLHPEVRKFEQHIYFSKEGTKGGYGVAGGGCGCN